MRFIFIFLFIAGFQLSAQVYETLPPSNIHTVRFLGERAEFSGTPIIRLGESLTLTFDDLNASEADYYYVIEHYDFDWTPSRLTKNEYLEGFDNIRILDYTNSFGTLQSYTHYELRIPNKSTEGLKVSGNYLLKILNDDEEIVFSRKFIVYENAVPVAVSIKRARDLKYIDTRQSVNFSVGVNDGAKGFIFRNPEKTVKTMLIQNNDLHSAITDLKPQYTIGNQLVYRYDAESSFWGGNEYLAFDSKDLRAATLSTRRVELIDIYHHYLYTDGVRKYEPYTYNPDINGHFVVTASQGQNDAVEAEYIWVHFALACSEDLNGGDLYLYGNFNNFALDETNKLTFNEESGFYEGKRLFKQGFYNYKYILLNPDGSVNDGIISGDFDETENQYTVVVYYCELGGRYDRVVGAGSANSRNITN
jgi:hypothetical protein